MQILVVGPSQPEIDYVSHSKTNVPNLLEVPKSKSFDCIVVSRQAKASEMEALKSIRSDPDLRLLPTFCENPDLEHNPMSDGLVPPNDMLETFVDLWRSRKSSLKIDPEADFESLVLSFLWLSPNRRLRASRNASDKQIYEYELLSLWDPGFDRAWLDRAERLGLIETDGLTDRLRHCATCDSAHLNYIDSCPNCTDIDIEHEMSIHCFTCGNVAEQERFLRNQKLVCPQCNTALRHIGTDYDRPIETHRCNACQQRFQEPVVTATCLDCGTANSLDHLKTRSVRPYRLAPDGEARARAGERSVSSTPVIYGEPIGREHFKWALRWLNDGAIAERPGVVAGLLFRNADHLDTGIMDDRRVRHIDTLAVQLRSLLSPRDVVTIDGDNVAFVILANGGAERLEAFARDVEKIQLSQIENEVELTVAGRLLPDSGIAADPGAWLDRFASDLRSKL